MHAIVSCYIPTLVLCRVQLSTHQRLNIWLECICNASQCHGLARNNHYEHLRSRCFLVITLVTSTRRHAGVPVPLKLMGRSVGFWPIDSMTELSVRRSLDSIKHEVDSPANTDPWCSWLTYDASTDTLLAARCCLHHGDTSELLRASLKLRLWASSNEKYR